MTDEELERLARNAGWRPVRLGDPAPSPLVVLAWMRWAFDLGVDAATPKLQIPPIKVT